MSERADIAACRSPIRDEHLSGPPPALLRCRRPQPRIAVLPNAVDASPKKIVGAEDRRQDSTGERRRLSRVRHDDRGNAYVEWVEAPAELVARPKLEISGELELETDKTCDPYANGAGATRKTGNTTRTDLRKLSEWIKMMRDLEERKRIAGDSEGEAE